MKQEIALEFCRSQNKDISILAESHIGQNQIHQIENKWLGPIIFAPGDTFSKGILILFHPGFDDITDVDTDPKGYLCPSRLLPLMTGFSVSMLLHVIVTENNWTEDASLKVYTIT